VSLPTPARDCLACAIVQGRITPPGGPIVVTEHFHAHQDVAYPVPGMVIVAARRHYTALDEMTTEEAAGFIALVRRVRRAQRQALGLDYVYYFYNEDTRHHFHLWMMPRLPWMTAFGASIESVRPALRSAAEQAGPAERAEVVRAVDLLRDALAPQ
jgi:diadenosine tetraphosphate (Ap4A) HIT family hydrolase